MPTCKVVQKEKEVNMGWNLKFLLHNYVVKKKKKKNQRQKMKAKVMNLGLSFD